MGGRRGSRNGIITAWSRLAHEPRQGWGNHLHRRRAAAARPASVAHGGMSAGQCSAHRTGRPPDAAPFVIYAVSTVMSSSFGFLIARNPPSRTAGVLTAGVL